MIHQSLKGFGFGYLINLRYIMIREVYQYIFWASSMENLICLVMIGLNAFIFVSTTFSIGESFEEGSLIAITANSYILY